MNKDGSNKNPIPENNIEKFMGMVWVLTDAFGINDIPDILHYVELLSESTTRYVFESTHNSAPKKTSHDSRKRFIAIFKARYAESYDLEYVKTITPIEAKLVNQLNKTLKESGFTTDDYLEWLFNDFLEENEKFRPPTIKMSCSQFIIHKFIVDNAELKETRKNKEIEKKISLDLISRARVLLRGGLPKDDDKKTREILKEYGDRNIMLAEFKTYVEELEKKQRQKQSKEAV
jgi:hypothetical protein